MNFDFNIADFFKLPTKIMASLAFASGLLLFLPDSIVTKIYMTEFRNNYGFIIGLIFITSFAILFVTLLIFIYKYLHYKYLVKKFKATAHEKLQKLDDLKKALIFDLYRIDNHTDELPLHDGAVNFLEQNMMIGKATNQYFVSDFNNACLPYTLQPWVIEELQNSSELHSSFQLACKRIEEKLNAEYAEEQKQNNNRYSNFLFRSH